MELSLNRSAMRSRSMAPAAFMCWNRATQYSEFRRPARLRCALRRQRPDLCGTRVSGFVTPGRWRSSHRSRRRPAVYRRGDEVTAVRRQHAKHTDRFGFFDLERQGGHVRSHQLGTGRCVQPVTGHRRQRLLQFSDRRHGMADAGNLLHRRHSGLGRRQPGQAARVTRRPESSGNPLQLHRPVCSRQRLGSPSRACAWRVRST